MRCFKSCCLCGLESINLFGNAVIGQILSTGVLQASVLKEAYVFFAVLKMAFCKAVMLREYV